MLAPVNLYLAREPTDMRCGIDALTHQAMLHLSPLLLIGSAIVFCNKTRSRIKVLHWDKQGVWLCSRRLHLGHFSWPRRGDILWSLTAEQFNWLIKGIDWRRVEEMTNPLWET